jgi:23S rRNA (guanine745-N1)-methyltransferase
VEKLSKREQSATLVESYVNIFQCPICGSSMYVAELKSIKCSKNHSFDLARQGYLNLLITPTKTKYDKQLFESRKYLMGEHSFFEPVISKIYEFIETYTNQNKLTILDTGSGDGSHLAKIRKLLVDAGKDVNGVGIDIAKEGILVAAKYYPKLVWCVADLANTPFRDKSFHVILNILSPSNYQEFNRILHDDGILIKVVPRSDYLKEVRTFFYNDSEKQLYSNDDIIRHFKERTQLLHQETVKYMVTLNKDAIKALVMMTPLTWGIDENKIDQFLRKGSAKITVDVDILIGSKV